MSNILHKLIEHSYKHISTHTYWMNRGNKNWTAKVFVNGLKYNGCVCVCIYVYMYVCVLCMCVMYVVSLYSSYCILGISLMIIIIGTTFKKWVGWGWENRRTVRLGVRTPLFHSGNTGSIPVRCTIGIKIKREYILVTLFLMLGEYPNIFIKSICGWK